MDKLYSNKPFDSVHNINEALAHPDVCESKVLKGNIEDLAKYLQEEYQLTHGLAKIAAYQMINRPDAC